MQSHLPFQRGFTLVELLVVITIIGILIALLLPAVQAAREAARRMQCVNNFKQVGLAMHNYHMVRECFPPGAFNDNPAAPVAECGPQVTAYWSSYGWAGMILPFIELQTVYDGIDWSGTYAAPAKNLTASNTRISTYLCPSDPQNGELVWPNSHDPSWTCRQTNMIGVADSKDRGCAGGYMRQFPLVDGVMGGHRGCRIGDVKDGTSNTLMIAEVTGGGPGTHIGYFWASYDNIDTANGINCALTVPGGTVWDTSYDATTGEGISSFHPGGCNFLMCDGSVHFISQNVSFDMLAALTTRDGASCNSNGAPDKVLVSGPP